MRSTSQNNNYGFPNGIIKAFPAPIVANRQPNDSDQNFVPGQIWVYKNVAALISTGIIHNIISGVQLNDASGPIYATATIRTTNDTPAVIFTRVLPPIPAAIGLELNLMALSITGGGCLEVKEYSLILTDGTTASKPFDEDILFNGVGDMNAADFGVSVSGNMVTMTVYGIAATTIDWSLQILPVAAL